MGSACCARHARRVEDTGADMTTLSTHVMTAGTDALDATPIAIWVADNTGAVILNAPCRLPQPPTLSVLGAQTAVKWTMRRNSRRRTASRSLGGDDGTASDSSSGDDTDDGGDAPDKSSASASNNATTGNITGDGTRKGSSEISGWGFWII